MGLGGLDWMGLGRWLPPRKTTLPDPELLTSRRLLDHRLKLPFNLLSIVEIQVLNVVPLKHVIVIPFNIGRGHFLFAKLPFLLQCNEWSLVLVENVDAR